MSILQPKKIVKVEGNKVTMSWDPKALLEDQFFHAILEDKVVSKGGGSDRAQFSCVMMTQSLGSIHVNTASRSF